ncbi:hypothetical protein BDV95DRAFT_582987 [Massariosphaeria phaeospora]|uniref:Uncharacterized protein n=1 Tax=Massariosphaeria phaeospora TaxID=100035 RepID=A0A7C8M3N7_9PLEO|nr:hypothetical protein BDV95DRAFT_582987 [Massariosphaeria phaeospora]
MIYLPTRDTKKAFPRVIHIPFPSFTIPRCLLIIILAGPTVRPEGELHHVVFVRSRHIQLCLELTLHMERMSGIRFLHRDTRPRDFCAAGIPHFDLNPEIFVLFST